MLEDEDIIFVADEDEFVPYEEYETMIECRRWYEDADIDAYLAHGWTWSLDDEFVRDDSAIFDEDPNRSFPTRYRLKDFRLSKSLRRVLNKNRDLKTIIRPLCVTPRKSALYEKHYARYGEKVYLRLQDKYRFPSRFPVKDMELCVYQNRKLLACSIFVVARKSIQSNSAFWDLNEPRRSLGILTVLLEMQYAIRKKKDFYYLGAYSRHNSNYQYKTRFPGLEFYDWDNNCWVDKNRAGELLDQKLKRKEVLEPFKIQDLCWLLPAPTQMRFPEIVGIAMFGSQIHGTARAESDIDVLIVTPDIERQFAKGDFVDSFGSFRYARREKWFSGETIRAFYREANGRIEFNFVKPEWAQTPPNDEARRIIKDGMKIVHDPHGILKKLQRAVRRKGVKS